MSAGSEEPTYEEFLEYIDIAYIPSGLSPVMAMLRTSKKEGTPPLYPVSFLGRLLDEYPEELLSNPDLSSKYSALGSHPAMSLINDPEFFDLYMEKSKEKLLKEVSQLRGKAQEYVETLVPSEEPEVELFKPMLDEAMELATRAESLIDEVPMDMVVESTVIYNRFDTLKHLVEVYGASVQGVNEEGQNLLAVVAKHHKPESKRDLSETIEYLLDKGVNPYQEDKQGKCAIDYIIEGRVSAKNNLVLIKKFIEKAAKQGRTLEKQQPNILIRAVSTLPKGMEVIKFLAEVGVNPYQKDKKGKSAIDYIKKSTKIPVEDKEGLIGIIEGKAAIHGHNPPQSLASRMLSRFSRVKEPTRRVQKRPSKDTRGRRT